MAIPTNNPLKVIIYIKVAEGGENRPQLGDA